MAQASSSPGLWQRLFGRAPQPQAPERPAPAASLKQQRAANREQLFGVVRENMIRAGVLSSTYKFKVLTLDPAGQQFIVMIDWQEGAGRTDSATNASLEKGLQQLSLERLGLAVKAVYWRHAGALPAQAEVHEKSTAAGNVSTAAAATAAAQATPAPASDPDAVSEDELAAFRAALRASADTRQSPAQSARPSGRSKPNDFQPTVITEDAPSTDFGSLSETQYGPLR